MANVYTNPYQEFTIGTPFNLAGKIVSYSPISSTQYSIKLENYDQWTNKSLVGQDDFQYPLSDNGSFNFPLTMPDSTARFRFFGVDYDTIYIGSNGYLTFTGPDTTGTVTIVNHFNQPRISMFFNQFKPSQNGTYSIYTTSLSGQSQIAVITYYNLTEPDLDNQNYTQVILYLNNYSIVSKRGRIDIIYGKTELTTCIIGISNGTLTNITSVNFNSLYTTPFTPSINDVFRYLKWEIKKISDHGLRKTGSAELTFYDENKTLINMNSFTITNPNGITGANLGPHNLINNNINDNWIDSNAPFITSGDGGSVILDLGVNYTYAIRPYYYSWYPTTPPYNSQSWYFYGSKNNTDWYLLDTQIDYQPIGAGEVTNGSYFQIYPGTIPESQLLTNPYEQFSYVLSPESPNLFDLSGRIITYYPNADNTTTYKITNQTTGTNSAWLPASPPISIAGHTTNTTLSNTDDSSYVLDIGATNKYFKIFGNTYSKIHIGTNGYITFDFSDTQYLESIDNHFNMVRLSVFFTDLSPDQRGSIYYGYQTETTLNDVLIITYLDVTEYNKNNSNNVQISLYLENATIEKRGRIKVHYGAVALQNCVVGLSNSYNNIDTPATAISFSNLNGKITLPTSPADVLDPSQRVYDINAASITGTGFEKSVRYEFTYNIPIQEFKSISGLPFDLQGKKITYNGISQTNKKYTITTTNSTTWTTPSPPNSISGHTQIFFPPTNQTDDAHYTITLNTYEPTRKFSFYENKYSNVYIGSNGTITFESPSNQQSPTITNHLYRSRIAALLTDLSPNQRGSVYYGYMTDTNPSDVLVITYMDITEFNQDNSNNVQILLYLENAETSKRGNIEVFYGLVDLTDCVIGLSPGLKLSGSTYSIVNFAIVPADIYYKENDNTPSNDIQPTPDPPPEPTPVVPPIINSLNYTLFINSSQSIEFVGTTTNNQTNTITYSIVSNPTNGTLGDIITTNNISTVLYTSNTGYTGLDQFTYQGNDGITSSNIATVNLTIRTLAEQQQTVTTNLENEIDLTWGITGIPIQIKNQIISDITQLNSNLDTDTNIDTYLYLLSTYKYGETITISEGLTTYQLDIDTVEKKEAIQKPVRAEMIANNLRKLTITDPTHKTQLQSTLTELSSIAPSILDKDIIIYVFDPYDIINTPYEIDLSEQNLNLDTFNIFFDIESDSSITLKNSDTSLNKEFTFKYDELPSLTRYLEDTEDANMKYYLDDFIPLSYKSLYILGLGSSLIGENSVINPTQGFTALSEFNLSGTILTYYPSATTKYGFNTTEDLVNGRWTSIPPINITNPETDTLLTLNNNIVLVQNEVSFSFCNTIYNYVFISTNGYLYFTNRSDNGSLNVPDYDIFVTPTVKNQLNYSRLSVFYTNLAPRQTGSITYGFIDSGSGSSDTLVITYLNVSVYSGFIEPYKKINIQVVLYLENANLDKRGLIEIYYGRIEESTTIIGISDGSGIGPDNYSPITFYDQINPPSATVPEPTPSPEPVSPMELEYVVTTGDLEIVLPLSGTVNVTVYWDANDLAIFDIYNTAGRKAHTYPTPGTYRVKIDGTLTWFGFNDINVFLIEDEGYTSTNKNNNISKVISFGEIGLVSLDFGFFNAINLTNVPATLPKNSAITNMYATFLATESLNDDNIKLWDTSEITDMSYMFYNAYLFNQDIGSWNISNVNAMNKMIYNTSLSTLNYDRILIGWSRLPSITPNVTFTSSTYYSYGLPKEARDTLTNIHTWNITDLGLTPRNHTLMSLDYQVSSVNRQITLPLNCSYINIDWGDSSSENINKSYDTPANFYGKINHTYDSDDTYTVILYQIYSSVPYPIPISGNILNFGTNADTYENIGKLVAINSLSGEELFNLNGAFNGATNLLSIPSTISPVITNLNYTFKNTSSLDPDLSSWDVSNIYNMSNILVGSGLSRYTYDSMLLNWNNLPSLQFNTTLDVGNVKYSYGAAALARQSIISNYNWLITDGGLVDITGIPMSLEYLIASNGEQITLPLSDVIDINIDWGDGNTYSYYNISGFTTINHIYQSSGTYQVDIYGSLIKFGYGYDAGLLHPSQNTNKLINVISFGEVGLTSLEGAFYNETNLVSVPANLPTTSTIVNLDNCFNNASGFTGLNISNWDVSSVISMTGMFLDSGLTTANYNDILVEWSQQSLQMDVYFNAGLQTKFSYGTPATSRNDIIINYNWTIVDGGPEDIQPGNPFTLIYETTTPDETILLPLYGNVNVSIYWDDLTKDDYTSPGDKTHIYALPGIYSVKIFGFLDRFGNGLNTNTTYADKLTAVESFGDNSIGLKSLSGAFKGASNLISVPAYLPPTITSLKYTFFDATSFNDTNILSWDTTNVMVMSYMFFNAQAFTQNLENWNKSNVSEQYYMYYGSETYEKDETLLLDKILDFAIGGAI
jgi:surface protein